MLDHIVREKGEGRQVGFTPTLSVIVRMRVFFRVRATPASGLLTAASVPDRVHCLFYFFQFIFRFIFRSQCARFSVFVDSVRLQSIVHLHCSTPFICSRSTDY